MKIHVHTSYPCSTRSSLVITVNCRITKDSKKFLFFLTSDDESRRFVLSYTAVRLEAHN